MRPGDNLDLFTKHASPEAIRYHLKKVRETERRLTKLLADRLSQIEAGEWPAPKTSTEEQS